MLTQSFLYLLVATFFIRTSQGAFVRIAHAGQQSQQQSQPSQNSTSQVDLSQLYPLDIYINDTLVWKEVLYGSVTHYLYIPQGEWIIKANSSVSNMSSTGGNTDINQTISISQDSNYTLAIYPQQSSNTSEDQNTTNAGSQSSLTASLFLEQLNSTSSYAYVKLYNFVPNAELSLVLLNQSSNMSTGGNNESTSSNNTSSSNETSSQAPNGQQIIIENVAFGNASEYTQINQTVAFQQVAILLNGQTIPLDDFKMNSTYLNSSFVQNFDFRFFRMGDTYSIFAIPAIPITRQFYVFGNDSMALSMGSNMSSNSNTSNTEDLLTQITRDNLPRAVSYIRFVSGVPDSQFSPVLDNSQITPVSAGETSNFYRVYAGLHIVSQSSQGQAPSTNETATDNVTTSQNQTSSGSSNLFLLLPSSLSDCALTGSSSNSSISLIPSNISFPLDINESAVKLVNLVSDIQSLSLIITSQNQTNANISTSEVQFLNASNYVVLNASSYSLLLMQNNQTVARLDNIQFNSTTYFTVFAISSPQQQNQSSLDNTTSSTNETQPASQIQLFVAMDTQTIALPIGNYARFIVSISGSQNQTTSGNSNANVSSENQTSSENPQQGMFTLFVDDVLVIQLSNGNITDYISMPSGRRNISLVDENGNSVGSSIIEITANSTQSILIFGTQQSLQFAVAQDTRRAALSIDSVRMRLINLDINSQSISLVQNQSTLISNVSAGNWSLYQDIMSPSLQLSSLSLSEQSEQIPIQPIQSNTEMNMGASQNQSQTLNPYLAYSIVSLAQSGAQNSNMSLMGVIVSDSTFQLQDICFLRFVHASPDAPAVDIFMNDLLVYSNLMPQNSTFYIPIIKGLFNISVVQSMSSSSSNSTSDQSSLNQTMGNENTTSSAPLLSVLFAFQTSSFFTFAIIEPAQNMSYVVLEDKVIPTKQMSNNSAQIRVVNLAFDTQGLSVSAISPSGQNISISQDLNYQESSQYAMIEPGQYSFVVTQGAVGSALKNISLEILSRNFYTIWITNANQSSVTSSTHHGAFIERQISEDNGAYWLDDIEDWAGSVSDLENDLFETASSSQVASNTSLPSNETSSENSTSSAPNSGMRPSTIMFGNKRFEDQIFFGNFLLNTTSMNISDTTNVQVRSVMGQWDRLYRAFYGAKEDPFGLGLALPRK
jgi:hypothetical protein